MATSFGQSQPKLQPGVVLAVLLVVCLACVTLYAREGEDGSIHAAQHAVSGLFGPLKAASGAVSVAQDGVAAQFADAQADPDSVTSLRQQNEQLRSTIAALEEYRQEALRLEGLLAMKNTYGAEGIPARVLSRSTDPWNLVVSADAGSAEGVRAGLPVLGASGLVGQVASVSEHSCDIRLLADPTSGVAVTIQSNREEGIVRGSLEGVLYLEDVADEVDVQPGDVVITSGLGGGYFAGMMVGTVLKVEGQAGATDRKIIIEQNEQAAPLSEVYVVTSTTTAFDGTPPATGSAGDAGGFEGQVEDYEDGYYGQNYDDQLYYEEGDY